MFKDADKERIRLARGANLGEYLLSIGEPLIRNGNRYRHKEHNSLIFTKNAYYWNSIGEHGNAVDYLVRHMNLSFKEAVERLSGSNLLLNEYDNTAKNFSWEEIKKEPNMSRTIAYLNKHRGIDTAIITDLIKRRLLFQQEGTNNAIFPIRDENGTVVGAELAGTLSDKRFKGTVAGSKYGYGYNVPCGENPRYILFFESAIDLLSFMDEQRSVIEKMDGSILVSLSGIKEPIFKHMLESLGSTLQPVLCVDNDNAGDEFTRRLQGKYDALRIYRPQAQFKDWNEQLLTLKKTRHK